jgi:FkbM family methyltransferase
MKDFLRYLRNVVYSQAGCTVGSTRYRLPHGVPVGIAEPWMQEVIKILLPKNDGVFLDIGVNLGQTLMSLRSVDKTRQYVGFEPNPSCVAAVTSIVQLNLMQNVTIIPLACDKKYRITKLYHYEDSNFDSSASMVSNFRKETDLLRTSLIASGDAIDCLSEIDVKKISFVKIDVEGFEAEVLEAIEPLLRRDKPTILIEVLPIRDNEMRLEAAHRISAVIDRLDYLSRRINKTREGKLKGFSDYCSVGSQSAVLESDYLLTPK